ncbi:hypothetical protein AZH53_07120 [Methanomicrobiaceae archaeon CYW5]|uniref:YqhA family protein n=1 Tax=Methanovulcanius yangii TaxID=1789227 RepID=UPI0029CAA7BB|nr:YqhA family protein [Methanovulcanius yangii]MBT8508174.1 hypothetical protein [Methanovulcanius yangii]
MFLKNVTLLTYIVVIAAVSSFAGSVLMFIIGFEKTISAWYYFIGGVEPLFPPEAVPVHLTSSNVATVIVIQATDAFLLALVLMIFGFGVYYLFLANDEEKQQSYLPNWLKMKNIIDLKMILGQVIVFILFVHYLEMAVLVGFEHLTYENLVIPIAIVLLSVSLMVVKRGTEDAGE